MSKSGFEYIYPLSIHPSVFVGTKPTAVLFGSERVEVKTWRQVVDVILGRCDREQHDNLMSLRNKVSGKVRMIFSDSAKGMRCPLQIGENTFVETHYGSHTMMYILRDLILAYTRFDYSDICIAVKR